jgi:hypothetical protein
MTMPPLGSGPNTAPATTAAPSKLGDQLLAGLLDDAKIVATYAQRAGLLSSSALPEAISAVENTPVRSWGDKAVVDLQSALNDTMRELAPTTLEDLRSYTAPFTRSKRLTLYNITFVLCWGLMILFVALGTVTHNYGISIVASLEQLQTDDTGRKIGELVRSIVSSAKNAKSLTGKEGGITDATTNGADFVIAATFLADLDEARELDEKTFIVESNAKRFIDDNLVAMKLLSPFTSVRSLFWPPASQGPAVQLGKTLCEDQEQKALAESYSRPEFGSTPIASFIRFNSVEAVSLTCMSGFRYHLRDYPSLQSYTGNINLILNVYGLWVLPALYGALGAAMYHLRRALNPILPTPPFLRTVNRTIMGAFAGIIIAWFWAPAAKSNTELVNVGFNLFAIAFLVGYGIDVFFAFLDRVLATATGSIGRLGTSDK